MGGLEGRVPRRLERLTSDDGLPERQKLPWYLAPVPRALENVGLHLAWLVVAANLAGTAFGFYYYRAQFGATPWQLWPFVPDSPLATLLFAAAIAAWLVGEHREWLASLAFVGNVVLGAWTPVMLVVFRADFATPPLMWQFLFWSHLAMIVQAFVLHRIAEFPPRAVAVAVCWYGANLVLDYFVPIVGEHGNHTALPVTPGEQIVLGATAHEVAAATAVVLTLAAVSLAFTIGVARRRVRTSSGAGDRAT